MKGKLVAVAALAPVVAMLGYNELAMRSQRDAEVRAQATQAAGKASTEVAGSSKACTHFSPPFAPCLRCRISTLPSAVPPLGSSGVIV
jgi:hypothetical protein